jgi:hypothetical protein
LACGAGRRGTCPCGLEAIAAQEILEAKVAPSILKAKAHLRPRHTCAFYRPAHRQRRPHSQGLSAVMALTFKGCSSTQECNIHNHNPLISCCSAGLQRKGREQGAGGTAGMAGSRGGNQYPQPVGSQIIHRASRQCPDTPTSSMFRPFILVAARRRRTAMPHALTPILRPRGRSCR